MKRLRKHPRGSWVEVFDLYGIKLILKSPLKPMLSELLYLNFWFKIDQYGV